MPDLERSTAIVDVQLAVAANRALKDTKHAELADEGIVDDLEDVGQDVQIGVEHRNDRRRRTAVATQERWRIAFAGMR
ncbi:MAG: hypothetical protein ABIR16_04690 [Dokdonella sp.]